MDSVGNVLNVESRFMCENNSNNSDKHFYTFSSRFICAIYFDVRKLPPLHHEKETLIRENKITLLVITLVVIFLICHTPNAVYSLYKSWQRHRESSNDEKKIKNFVLGKFPVTQSDTKDDGRRKKEKFHLLIVIWVLYGVLW